MAIINHFARVGEFHTKFKHEVRHDPMEGEMNRKLVMFRLKLIAEEFSELCDAAGCNVSIKVQDRSGLGDEFDFIEQSPYCKFNLPEIADALGDIGVVIEGFALIAGIPYNAVRAEIHGSNMSKLGANGEPIIRADGKIIKGPDYYAPEIAKLLRARRNINISHKQSGLPQLFIWD